MRSSWVYNRKNAFQKRRSDDVFMAYFQLRVTFVGVLDSHASGHTLSGGDAACAGMTIIAWIISIMLPLEACSEFLDTSLHGV